MHLTAIILLLLIGYSHERKFFFACSIELEIGNPLGHQRQVAIGCYRTKVSCSSETDFERIIEEEKRCCYRLLNSTYNMIIKLPTYRDKDYPLASYACDHDDVKRMGRDLKSSPVKLVVTNTCDKRDQVRIKFTDMFETEYRVQCLSNGQALVYLNDAYHK